MSDGQSLYAVILDKPDDDGLRLIYADWLEENAGESSCDKCNGVGRIPYCGNFVKSCNEQGKECDCTTYGGCSRCNCTGRVSNHFSERAEFIRVQYKLASIQKQQVELLNEEIDWRDCTGIAASWCPNCGDCCCPVPEDEMCDPNCPIHSASSKHCILDSLASQTESFRERQEEIFDFRWLPEVGGQLCEWHFQCFPADLKQDRPFAFAFVRGFVESVSLSLAQFLQHGREIAARHPVTTWVLTDVKPNSWNATEAWWVKASSLGEHYEVNAIPDEIFSLLRPFHEDDDYDDDTFRHYPSVKLAIADLQQSCYAYARMPELKYQKRDFTPLFSPPI